MQLKLVLRILVMLFSWLLILIDNCAYRVAEVLAVFIILTAGCSSGPMLTPAGVELFGPV